MIWLKFCNLGCCISILLNQIANSRHYCPWNGYVIIRFLDVHCWPTFLSVYISILLNQTADNSSILFLYLFLIDILRCTLWTHISKKPCKIDQTLKNYLTLDYVPCVTQTYCAFEFILLYDIAFHPLKFINIIISCFCWINGISLLFNFLETCRVA